jgi:transcription elongation factor GreB
MSKAFVKEGEDDEDDAPEPAPPRGLGRHITRDGYRKLKEELAHLWRAERPKVTAEVTAAAAQGDRSENAEYIYGKKRLREIDRRIRFLEKRLDVLTVVEPSPEQRGRVFFGAWVTVEDEDGASVTYRLVGSDEIDLDRRWISMESPLGRALTGHREGDEVTVHRPRGPVELVITRISYEEPGAPG